DTLPSGVNTTRKETVPFSPVEVHRASCRAWQSSAPRAGVARKGNGRLLRDNPDRRLQDFVAAFCDAFDGPRHGYGRLNSDAMKLRPILVQRLQPRPAQLEPAG